MKSTNEVLTELEKEVEAGAARYGVTHYGSSDPEEVSWSKGFHSAIDLVLQLIKNKKELLNDKQEDR